jgi:hypothetical protein
MMIRWLSKIFLTVLDALVMTVLCRLTENAGERDVDNVDVELGVEEAVKIAEETGVCQS